MSSRKALFLNYIWHNPGASRKEMVSIFGLHPNLVSDAVRELIQEQWIIETGPKKSASGRSPISLQLHPEKRVAFVVSYTPQALTCALVNADGEILRKIEADHVPQMPEQLVESAARMFNQMKREYPGLIIGVGVADPGMIDSERGEVIRSSTFPTWRHVPMVKLFEKKIGVQTLLEDMTHARAMAQYRSLTRTAHNKITMLYLDYGAGLVGFTWVTPAGVWHGGGFAGEVGHVIFESGGRLCRCGASGCLESLVGTLAVEAKAKDLLSQGVNSILQGLKDPSAEAIFQAALEGDRMSQEIVHGIASPLGLASSILAAAFHPHFLVVGGILESAIRCITNELKSALQARTVSEIASSVQVVEGQASPSLAVIGAGLKVFEEVILQNDTARKSTNRN